MSETIEKLSPIELERINKLLADHYGIETISGRAMWRLVWANDEMEIRYGTYQDYSGNIFIREVTEARLINKYFDIHDRYVLEHLVVVPYQNMAELPDSYTSYEPLWTFEGRHEEYVVPTFEACAFICNTVLASMGHGSLAKYKEIFKQDERGERIKKLEHELFGNETPVTDALAYKTGVVNPWEGDKS